MHQGKCVGCSKITMVNAYYPNSLEAHAGIKQGAYCAECFEKLDNVTHGHPGSRRGGIHTDENPSLEKGVRELEDG